MKYLIRSVKYLLHLCVLSAVLIAVLFAVGMNSGTPEELIYMMIHTSRGYIFVGAIVLFSAFYPKIGFMTAHIKGDILTHREQIIDALRIEGFTPIAENEDMITFRAKRIMQRLMFRFDDTITVRQQQDGISIEGLRKIVARAEYRVESLIRKENE